jgi:hypothetical protein
MANLKAPNINFSGAFGQPTSQGSIVNSEAGATEIAPPGEPTYTGGIRTAPAFNQLLPQNTGGFGF